MAALPGRDSSRDIKKKDDKDRETQKMAPEEYLGLHHHLQFSLIQIDSALLRI